MRGTESCPRSPGRTSTGVREASGLGRGGACSFYARVWRGMTRRQQWSDVHEHITRRVAASINFPRCHLASSVTDRQSERDRRIVCRRQLDLQRRRAQLTEAFFEEPSSRRCQFAALGERPRRRPIVVAKCSYGSERLRWAAYRTAGRSVGVGHIDRGAEQSTPPVCRCGAYDRIVLRLSNVFVIDWTPRCQARLWLM